MVAATEIGRDGEKIDGERRVLLHGVSWSAYVGLRDSVKSRTVHMTYLKGALEITTVGRTHEVRKKQMARLLELFCLERDIPLYGYGSMTLENEELESALEPDECYRRDHDGEVPDVALEVVVTNPLLNRLEVYRNHGVREVWVFKAKLGSFELFTLRGERYEPLANSEVLPEVPLDRIAHYAPEVDQHAALLAFRAELRAG
jgi:Uma2 family endonuclease